MDLPKLAVDNICENSSVTRSPLPINKLPYMTNRKYSKLKAIDFFCGAGGMTAGFQQAGIHVLAGIDVDEECKSTYESNNPESLFIHADIKNLSFEYFEKTTKVRRNDDFLVFIGCSPCQYWSKIKTDKSKSAKSKNLLSNFQHFVKEYLPGFVVIENVPGLYTQRKSSPLNGFLKFLDKNNYNYKYAVLNFSHHGIPQTRKRFLLIASRVTDSIELPSPHLKTATVRDFIGPKCGFPSLSAGHTDKNTTLHTTAGLSEINLRRIRSTPKNGGTRLTYVNNQCLAIPSQFKITHSFSDTYGRMTWDKPAPTITTKFVSLSNGRFGHPEQDRALSLREGATLQTFDMTYVFHGNSIGSIARQIGNAVPPLFSQQIASSIITSCPKKRTRMRT